MEKIRKMFSRLPFSILRPLLIFAFGISFIFTFNSCEKKEEKVIKIGAILPLTGPAGVPGSKILKGLKLAFKDTNIIKLIVEDSKSNVKEGLSAYNKIITIHNPHLIIVGLSSVAKAIMPEIDKRGIPTIITLSNYPKIAKNLKYGLRFFIDAEYEVDQIVKYLQRKKIKKIGIYYMEDEGSFGVFEIFKKKFKYNIVFTETFKKEEINFRNLIIKNKNKRYEALLCIGYGSALGNLIAQIRELGIKVPIFSTSPMGSSDAQKAARNAFYENVFFTTPYFDFNTDSLANLFRQDYRKYYNSDPDFLSAFGFDIGKMIMEFLRINNYVWNNTSFIKFAKNYSSKGVSGKIFSDTLNNINPLIVIVSYTSPNEYKLYLTQNF